MTAKQIKEDTTATFRGLKKVTVISVGVIEALAWGGLLAMGWTIIYKTLEGQIAMGTPAFAAVAFSTAAITLRALVELARYFKQVGSEYER